MKNLADLLLPDLKHDYLYYENLYKDRSLKEGAMVTRFAPSPTGFIHMGSLFSALCSYWYAKQSDGVAFLRIEDTDQKREVEDGIEQIINDFNNLNIYFDEDPIKGGNYEPYIQSKREDIYKVYVHKLINEGLAYPCFCSEEDLSNLRKVQEAKKDRIGYYGKYAKCRYLKEEEIIANINKDVPFVVRLKSPGSFNSEVVLNDLIKGKIKMPENDLDIVILKSDGLPTYHFAHAIDDYLMKTTHVIRGDEWVSSYPIHDQLFKVLNFKLPYYAHIAPINIKEDGDIVRKLSKRKDPEAAINFYTEKGIPNEVIMLYLATLMNSNFEEWYNNNPEKHIDDFEFSFNKMSTSGPLFDYEKLINISRTHFTTLSGEEIYNNLLNYTKEYDVQFYNILKEHREYTIELLNIERHVKKPRKDISSYSDIKNLFWYMYDELFELNDEQYEPVKSFDETDFIMYFNNIYSDNDEQSVWWNKLVEYADGIGYTKDKNEYKNNPDNFKGNTAYFCEIIRIIITKKNVSPNLYDLLKILNKDKMIQIIKKAQLN